MIEIQDITALTHEDIVNLLLEEGQPFEIYLPKSSQQFFSSTQDLAIDSAEAAYAGQLLSEVADEFEYDYVSPAEHKSVRFTIKCSNILKLSEVLYEISFACGREYEDSDPETFYMLATYFLEDVQEGRVEPKCPEFAEDFFEFMDELREENSEDFE